MVKRRRGKGAEGRAYSSASGLLAFSIVSSGEVQKSGSVDGIRIETKVQDE